MNSEWINVGGWFDPPKAPDGFVTEVRRDLHLGVVTEYRFVPSTAQKPKVYTLCGSSRFPDAFHLVNAHLSMRGHVVVSLGLFGHADEPRGARFLTSDGDEKTPEKAGLDQLHFRKIDLADAIFIVNVGGYIGSSTKREIAYAKSQGKSVEWLFPAEAAHAD